MLNITQSQRIDLLFATMQDFFAAHPIGVLEAQQVIVPSHGVGVWLRYQLASQQGISARLNTDFFGTYQWTLYRRVLGNDIPKNAPFARQVIQWRLFSYFLAVLAAPEQHQQAGTVLKPLLEKLQTRAKHQQRLLWKMAEQIAQVFASYVLYRPEWLRQWGKGQLLDIVPQIKKFDGQTPEWLLERYSQMEIWQQFLWQTLFSEDFIKYQGIGERFWQILEKNIAKRRVLPKSLTVFTVLQLPPSEFNFLKQLAQYIDVQFLHYNPSQEYWADSVDPLWLKQFELKNPRAAAFYDSRHPLLTRLGKQARDIFALLVELSGNDEGQWVDLFPDYFPNTLLGQLQNDILYLVEPEKHSHSLLPQDRSIQIHACHSPLRQLEVLREELIQWLSEDTSRQPADIVVFVPNLLEIAPLIRTVFSGQSGMHLPVHITGVAQADAEQLWQAMIGRYALLDGRFSIEDLLDWLALEAVQELYCLSREQVQRLGELLVDAGFRRGFDAEHLQQTLHQDDRDTRFSLQFALNRLMLGIAMPVQAIHADILPYVDVGRQDFELIARLSRIYQDLAARRDLFKQQHNNLQDWLNLLRDELSTDFAHVIHSTAGKDVSCALDELQASLDLTQSSQLNLPLRFVLDEVGQILEQAPPGSIPTGKITFSRLGTLRPLPYRLVVMLNLDSGLFPARDNKNTFDLMSVMPAQRGDRSRQIDEQGAFLDGLLLAQDACWMFYNGFDAGDSHPRQPSGTLQELIEFVDSMLKPEPLGQPTLVHIVHYHTLEPFEANNFQALQPRSFIGTWSNVASNLQQQFPVSTWLNHQFQQQINAQQRERQVLSLDRIIRQLCRPASHFLSETRVQPIARQDLPTIFEPLSLSKLDEYHIRALHQQQPEQLAHGHLQAVLPVGSAAMAYWKKSQLEAARNRKRLQVYGEGETPVSEYLLELAAWQLLAKMPQDEHCALWLSQYPYKHKGQRQLRYWLEHLAWQIQRKTSGQDVQNGIGQRVIVLSDTTLIYDPVEASMAREQLLQWLDVWQQASCQPWVLPPNLVLHNSGIHYDAKTSSVSIKNPDGLLKQWLEGSYGFLPAHEQEDCALHRDWQLILRGQDSGRLFLSFLEQHAIGLYQPIKQFSQVLAQ
ncbi:exodeoxyribonuclease V subunit gamma [Alkanindiges sp. WGS2144]|uniref:exodeoxyribonuclease V subunit gamma n=1 Tax=Alkanindiges sp. WGS2144 TaxID=3366808 RepID=UPI003752036D